MGDSNLQQIDPWQQARRAVKALGDMSATFTTCVRCLINNDSDNKANSKQGVGLVTSAALERLLRSPTVVSHLYYAALTYHGDIIKAKGKIKTSDFINIFGLSELAALLTVIFFYRRVTRVTKPEDWDSIGAVLQQYADIAIPLGAAIPSIGPIRALMVGAARYLAFGAILAVDQKGFKKYKVNTKVAKVAFDLKQEIDNWQTTFAHIGATMFQTFGYGVEFSNAYYRGITHVKTEELTEEEKKFRVAQEWLDALVRTGAAPQEGLGDEYNLTEELEESFIERVTNLVEKGSEFNWLTKGKNDLSPEKTPFLDYDYERVKLFAKNTGADSVDEVDSDGAESGTPG